MHSIYFTTLMRKNYLVLVELISNVYIYPYLKSFQ